MTNELQTLTGAPLVARLQALMEAAVDTAVGGRELDILAILKRQRPPVTLADVLEQIAPFTTGVRGRDFGAIMPLLLAARPEVRDASLAESMLRLAIQYLNGGDVTSGMHALAVLDEAERLEDDDVPTWHHVRLWTRLFSVLFVQRGDRELPEAVMSVLREMALRRPWSILLQCAESAASRTGMPRTPDWDDAKRAAAASILAWKGLRQPATAADLEDPASRELYHALVEPAIGQLRWAGDQGTRAAWVTGVAAMDATHRALTGSEALPALDRIRLAHEAGLAQRAATDGSPRTDEDVAVLEQLYPVKRFVKDVFALHDGEFDVVNYRAERWLLRSGLSTGEKLDMVRQSFAVRSLMANVERPDTFQQLLARYIALFPNFMRPDSELWPEVTAVVDRASRRGKPLPRTLAELLEHAPPSK